MGAPTRIGPNISLVGIVYSKALGHVRQHVYAEDDHAEFDLVAKSLQPGEAMCFVDIAHHHAGHDVFYQAIRDAVKAHGGIDAILDGHEPWADGHHWAQVHPVTKEVMHVTLADPSIDNVKLFDANGKRVGATVTHPDGRVEFTQHLTLDEMGFVNVPKGHSRVDVGHIHDPATGTFSNPKDVPHPSKVKRG